MIVEQRRNKELLHIAFNQTDALSWKVRLRNEDHDFENDGANVELEEEHKDTHKSCI